MAGTPGDLTSWGGVITSDDEDLSSRAVTVIDDLRIPAELDGRLTRHAAGTLEPRRHRHFELELNLVVSGTASYVLADRRCDLAAGTLLWLFPAQDHLLVEQSPDHVLWWAVFRPDLTTQLFEAPTHLLNAQNPAGDYSRRLDPISTHRLSTLCADLESLDPDDSLVFNAGLRYLLALAWQMYNTDHQAAHPSVELAAQLIRTETEPRPLTSLAAQVGLSPSHLSRQFAQQMGRSITHYRNEQRLNRFLRHYDPATSTSLLAAALDAGFGSYAQFHRVFVKATGQTPSSLRRTTDGDRRSARQGRPGRRRSVSAPSTWRSGSS